jgi:hypothetical protein
MRDLVGAIARLGDATGFVPTVLDVEGGWAYPADPESGQGTPRRQPSDPLTCSAPPVRSQRSHEITTLDGRKRVVDGEFACGAYAQTFGATLNSLPRPAVVLVRGDQARVVVRRDTLDDILGRYQIPSWLSEAPSPHV